MAAATVSEEAVRIATIGFTAHAALSRSRGAARPVAALSRSRYIAAGGEILWLGPADAALHPRAILTQSPVPTAHRLPRLRIEGMTAWHPPRPRRAAGGSIAARAAALRDMLGRIGRPAGLGLALGGETPPFPLGRQIEAAAALARACAAGDAAAALRAAWPLIGLGPGLTPAGDDFVGGALFARRLTAAAGTPDGRAWDAACDELTEAARARTTAVSAALLADLAAGYGFAPLHELAVGLVEGADPDGLLPAARRLVAIGHSSGWDMLAGFIAGTTGALAPEGGTIA